MSDLWTLNLFASPICYDLLYAIGFIHSLFIVYFCWFRGVGFLLPRAQDPYVRISKGRAVLWMGLEFLVMFSIVLSFHPFWSGFPHFVCLELYVSHFYSP